MLKEVLGFRLIGARYFNKGYAQVVGPLNSTFQSPRDNEGHGSHTLSTAGGNFVEGTSVFGFGNGAAKGGSPRARVAAYKVCWPPVGEDECFDVDILAAFDVAIHDGVDLLSVSLEGNLIHFFNDSVAIGSFHAVKHGIVVVCSAGNSGPADGTVSNIGPWQITVGASTIGREFPSYVVLANNVTFKGETLSATALPSNKLYPLISAAKAKAANASVTEAVLCKVGTLDPKKVKGKILVCLRGDNARVDKGEQALLAGAVGMVLANNDLSGNEIIADPHVLPASHINFTDGYTVYKYINSTKSPRGYITHASTKLGTKPAPFMAAFSSKGPNIIIPEILKLRESTSLSQDEIFAQVLPSNSTAFRGIGVMPKPKTLHPISCSNKKGTGGVDLKKYKLEGMLLTHGTYSLGMGINLYVYIKLN
ncbi:hypothetical protein FNV43_RR10993 [Rhamnella rubrinervis]|uniref:Subtilisin-like protease SBT5.3 n=1 Tax=Rhamnella rubrinervis TaxID=2594499 RepID=A0A8K0H4R4_9ROSA|nr:hypothetical protein FNV43_RR10993 [Rhamnella rubrinervis]